MWGQRQGLEGHAADQGMPGRGRKRPPPSPSAALPTPWFQASGCGAVKAHTSVFNPPTPPVCGSLLQGPRGANANPQRKHRHR